MGRDGRAGSDPGDAGAHSGGEAKADAGGPEAGDAAGLPADGDDGSDADESGDAESMPAFMTYGIFTVVVYAVAVGSLVGLPTVEVHDPSLVAFTVGFSVFMTVYFGSMWVGWLLVR